MDLKPTVSETRTELFEALQSDGSFVSWARGRIAPVDRFLSNFHKPLQRRMLFSDPKHTFPESGVLRLKSSQEIFLVGESREDGENDESFDRLTVLHVVSNSSSGLTEYFNYRHDLADSLVGNIAKTSEGDFYVAVEYVSTKAMEAGDEAYQGKFFVYGPANIPFARDGVFEVLGKNYKVVQAFHDSGFSCAIVLEQPDDMVGIVYHQIDESASGYDVVTGSLTIGTIDHTLAATVDHVRQDAHGYNHYDIFVKTHPLPVALIVGNNLTLPSGEKLTIRSKVEDVNTQGQVHLACEGG